MVLKRFGTSLSDWQPSARHGTTFGSRRSTVCFDVARPTWVKEVDRVLRCGTTDARPRPWPR
eukprot:1081740-Prymnesium_polylepis.1